MTTLTDSFTGGYNAAVWDEFKQQSDSTISEANNQIETTQGATGEGGVGLVTKTAYDLTAPSSSEINFTKRDWSGWIQISTNKVGLSGVNPFSIDDWYRMGAENGTYYAQKKIGAGTPSTVGSGTAAAVSIVYKIDLPSSGNEVRFIEGATEKASEATYGLASRDCYSHPYAYTRVGASDDEGDFDDFSMTYVAAGGATLPAGSLGLMGVGI